MLVAPETTLEELHTILQGAMGWEHFHLYRFGWTMRMDGRIVGDSWWSTFVDDDGNSTRAIEDADEREKYQTQVWGA